MICIGSKKLVSLFSKLLRIWMIQPCENDAFNFRLETIPTKVIAGTRFKICISLAQNYFKIYTSKTWLSKCKLNEFLFRRWTSIIDLKIYSWTPQIQRRLDYFMDKQSKRVPIRVFTCMNNFINTSYFLCWILLTFWQLRRNFSSLHNNLETPVTYLF